MVKDKKRKSKDKKTGVQDNAPSFPIVALGSSAGGLEALETFFKSTSPEMDMAYVIITHLEPHSPSLLAEIISKSTTMEAVQAENDMVVQKNRIYVIPPGKQMIIAEGALRLMDRPPDHEVFLPIDYFLRSLAQDRKDKAVAVILSGNGSDGSFGIRAIHANLGMVMVQSPETAKYDSMPRSAIETGLADYVLPPNEMPQMINKYIHAIGDRIKSPKDERVAIVDQVHKILSIVKNETGHDFSLYKKSTINRRIERRMTLHEFDTQEKYVNYLLANPNEIHSLFKELIIDVTSFFRNPEAFASLKEDLRKTVFIPGRENNFRAWVSACSTGEEAYSIGIVLKELMDETGKHLQVQIFASDINEDAINSARAGEYPLAIADDVDAERLEKYFIKGESGYKVKKEIREMVIFATQDLIKDPPFIHLDLLTCRNLLIYFEPALQRKVLETFSSALNPDGILFLGESETIMGFEDRFIPINPKWKIFRRKWYATPLTTKEIAPPVKPAPTKKVVLRQTEMVQEPSIREVAEKILLSEHTPPSLIVNDKNDIVYFHGQISKYLGPTSGRASLNIQNLLREDIRYAVMSALNESRSTGRTIEKDGVQFHTNGATSFLNIVVRPMKERKPVSGALVVFDEKSIPQKLLKEKQKLAISSGVETKIEDLERELGYTKESLQSTIEELETANEELTSTNEELQSNNEELQSVVEESETGKEELNSLNEELLTVNTELERRNQELSRTNSDMRNLLNSIDEALLFLDIDLKIRRFTPQMERIMNLIEGDLGRPIQDINMNLPDEDLVMEAKKVLDTLVIKVKEVQRRDGHWFKLKILPYRTVENVINGVVITLMDIDAQKKFQEKLKQISLQAEVYQKRAESIVDTVKEPLIVLDENLIVQSANTSFLEQFKTKSENVQGHPISEILDGMWNVQPLIDRLHDLSMKDTELENLSTEIVFPKLGKLELNITARKLLIPSGRSKTILVNMEMEDRT